MNKVVYIKTEKFSAENMWQQTQFNEKIGKYGKSKLKNIVKYNLLEFDEEMSAHWPFLFA
jgi:FPC/CPF motif-containing protein YcgG